MDFSLSMEQEILRNSVRDFAEAAFKVVGRTIEWRGEGEAEKGHDADTGALLIEIDPRYYRPTEVDHLQGDASKAKQKLGWAPKISFAQMVEEMVEHDISQMKRGLDFVRGSHDTV